MKHTRSLEAALCVVAAFGGVIVAAAAAQTAPPRPPATSLFKSIPHLSSQAKNDITKCFATYDAKHYHDAVSVCRRALDEMQPAINAGAKTFDAKQSAAICMTAYLLSDAVAMSYHYLNQPDKGRDMAQKAVDWALAAYGAMKELNPHLLDPNNPASSNMFATLRVLDRTYPGTVEDEVRSLEQRKVIQP